MDFKTVREQVPIEKAAEFLGIELKKDKDKFRCFCPACDKDRVLIITPAKGVFYCHNEKRGGDVSDLVAHVKRITQFQAMKLLADQFMREPEPPKPVQKRRKVNRSRWSSPNPTPTVNDPPPELVDEGDCELAQWETFISRL